MLYCKLDGLLGTTRLTVYEYLETFRIVFEQLRNLTGVLYH